MQIDGEIMEIVTDFILGGSKITADGDCSHEIKRCLLLGRKDCHGSPQEASAHEEHAEAKHVEDGSLGQPG